MCVRELRSTEAPNVIVFYLAIISTLGALTGVIIQARSLGDAGRIATTSLADLLVNAMPDLRHNETYVAMLPARRAHRCLGLCRVCSSAMRPGESWCRPPLLRRY